MDYVQPQISNNDWIPMSRPMALVTVPTYGDHALTSCECYLYKSYTQQALQSLLSKRRAAADRAHGLGFALLAIGVCGVIATEDPVVARLSWGIVGLSMLAPLLFVVSWRSKLCMLNAEDAQLIGLNHDFPVTVERIAVSGGDDFRTIGGSPFSPSTLCTMKFFQATCPAGIRKYVSLARALELVSNN